MQSHQQIVDGFVSSVLDFNLQIGKPVWIIKILESFFFFRSDFDF